MKKRARKFAELLKVLAVDTRVQIILHLKQDILCVNALAARLDVTQGAVSQHLRILRAAGIVTAEKRGCYVHYRLNEKAIEKLLAEAGKLFAPREALHSERECAKHCSSRSSCNH